MDLLQVVPEGDRLHPECLSEMVEVFRQSESVGVVGSYQRRGEEIVLAGFPYDQNVFDGREVVRRIFMNDEWLIGNPSSLMMRSSMLPDPFLDRAFRHSHLDGVFRLLLQRQLGVAHQVLSVDGDRNAARGDRADRIRSTFAEDLLLLLRYGSEVLSEREFEDVLARYVARYRRSHILNALKPSRLVNTEFLEFHRGIATALAEASLGRRDVQGTVKLVSMLLRQRAERVE